MELIIKYQFDIYLTQQIPNLTSYNIDNRICSFVRENGDEVFKNLQAGNRTRSRTYYRCPTPHLIVIYFQLKGREIAFQTSNEGEFWRILLPGIYKLEVSSEEHFKKEIEFSVIEQVPASDLIISLRSKRRKSADARSDDLKEKSLNKQMLGPFKNPRFFDRKDIKNLIEWSFSLLNVINLLNIVSFLQ